MPTRANGRLIKKFDDQIQTWGATGEPVMPFIIPPGGNHFWVNPAEGSSGGDGSYDDPINSLETAYALTTANQHDVIHYVSDSSGNNLAAAVTWSNNYTHLVGHCAPTGIANRSRIFQTSTLTDASPLFTVSASGCIFANFYIFQGVDDDGSLINVSVTGGRNYFWRVHFAGGGHATQAINGGMSLKLDGAEENVFEECTVGVDTIDAATGMIAIGFDGEAHRNLFRNSTVRMRAGNSGAAFGEVLDTTGIDRDTIFDNCMFINNHTSTAMDTAFIIPAGISGPRHIIMKDCISYGATVWDTNDTGVLIGNMDAVTGADLSGVAVELDG